ncbi:MAG: hypothetical protein ACHQRM_17530 [Bacteroidia bacterium]
MKPRLSGLLTLLTLYHFPAYFYAQQRTGPAFVFEKCIHAQHLDSTILPTLKADSNFKYQYYKRDLNGKRLTVSHNFTYTGKASGETADSIYITVGDSFMGRKDKDVSLFYYYSKGKGKQARKKFKEVDKAMTKAALRRNVNYFLGDKDNEKGNEITYIFRFLDSLGSYKATLSFKACPAGSEEGSSESWSVNVYFSD